jgi:hypothetical protein
MTKKIKLMHYRKGKNVARVDYNNLKVEFFEENNYHYRLLGSNTDRIESNLMYNDWKKIYPKEFDLLKDKINLNIQ